MRLFSLILLSVFMLSFHANAQDFSSLKENIRAYRNIKKMPEIPLVEFYDASGKATTLEQFRGKTVLLNFWATWCPPCIKEMPDLNKLAQTFKDRDFAVIVIASGRQGRETPDDFLQNRELTSVLSYHDPKQNYLQALKFKTLPLTFVIDPEGRLRGGVVGRTEWATNEAIAALEKAIP